jgi:hypothetical protein
MSLYEDLRGGGRSRERREVRNYSFEGGSNEQSAGRFRVRPSGQKKGQKVRTRTDPQKHPGAVVDVERTRDFDRPWGGPGPQEPQPEVIHPRPATVRDLAIDLGLRVLEMVIVAAAQEVVYYFAVRRFYPPQRGFHHPVPPHH